MVQYNNNQNQKWADRPKLSDYTYTRENLGVTYEIAIALANKMQIDPRVNIPHQADYDYILEMAKLLKTDLDPKLKVRIEYANEVWNRQFEQASYANEMGRKLWAENGDPEKAPGDSWLQLNGLRTSQMCNIWKKKVFREEVDRAVCVISTQIGWNPPSFVVESMLDCPFTQAQNITSCYKNGIDEIGVTGYFGGGLNEYENWPTIKQWIQSDKDGGVQKAVEQIKNGKYFKSGDTLDANKAAFQEITELAKQRGMKMVAYESIDHLNAAVGPDIEAGETQSAYEEREKMLTKLFEKIANSPQISDIYQQNLNNWKSAGGTLIMHFSYFGKGSKYGQWGILDSVWSQVTAPKYLALKKFQDENACWW